MTLWLILALCSALFLGGYEVARKGALVDNAPVPILLSASVGGWCALALSLVAARGSAFSSRYHLDLVPLDGAQHGAILIKAAIVSTSWVFAYISVKHLPITVAGPLRAISPALTVLGALALFQEQPTSTQWLGMAVMFAGYFALSRATKREGISFHKSKWVGLLLVGTIVGAMSGLYDKYLLQRVLLPPTTLQFWFVTYAVLLQALLALLWWYPGRKNAPFRFSWAAPLAGALLVLADQFYFRCLAEPDALVSVVSLVRRSSAIVSFSLGSMLFQDRFVASKAKALFVVLLGLLILLDPKWA